MQTWPAIRADSQGFGEEGEPDPRQRRMDPSFLMEADGTLLTQDRHLEQVDPIETMVLGV